MSETSKVERCLTISEPHAWGIASGVRSIDNRNWYPRYRGTIAIHASRNQRMLRNARVVREFLAKDVHVEKVVKALSNGNVGVLFHPGHIIGIADLVDVIERDHRPSREQLTDVNDCGIPDWIWARGPVCLMFRNAHRFRHPIPAKSDKLNLWSLSPEQEEAVAWEMQSMLDDPVEQAARLRERLVTA